MTFIYVLQLEEGKWYIGKTDSSKFRIETHFDNNGSEFTKKYKPEEIYQIIPECDKYDEDKYVKKYMDKYGIDNVRGGSYSRLELEEDEKRLIQKELWAANDLCFLCGGDHFIKECPSKKQIKEETEIDELKNVEELKEEERDKYIKYYEDMLFELTEGCWVPVSYDSYMSNLNSKYSHKTDSTYPTKIYTKYDAPPIDFENIKEIKYLLDGREINTFSGKVLVREHKPRYYSIAIIFNEVNCGKNNYIYYTYKFGPFKFDRFLLNGYEVSCDLLGILTTEYYTQKKKICEYNLFMLKNAVFSSKTSVKELEVDFKISDKLSNLINTGKTAIEKNYNIIISKIDEIINNIPEYIVSEDVDRDLLYSLYEKRLNRSGIPVKFGEKHKIINIDSIIFIINPYFNPLDHNSNRSNSIKINSNYYCSDIIVNYIIKGERNIASTKSLFNINIELKPNEKNVLCDKLNEDGFYTYDVFKNFAIIL